MIGTPPHICFVAPNAYPLLANIRDIQVIGGAELQQVIIARGLVQRGYRVSMICLNFGQEDRCDIDGIVVHRAFRPAAGLPVVRFIWPRLTSILRCLKSVDADIYYQRAASMLTGVVAAYCRHHGSKSIFAVAGDPMIRFRRDRWIYEYGIKHVDRVVVQNAEQARAVREEMGRDCILIPNTYQPPQCRDRPSAQRVLWVSTIRQLKRPERFLDVAEAMPNHRFTMVGGTAGMGLAVYDAIKARADTLENVEFVGFVPYAEIDRYFDNAVVFVNTSETEGFPNTFLQSWSRGVPTVSFIDSGARVNGSPLGRVVGSTGEMIKAVKNLLEDDSERSRLGRDCKRYVEENHAPERILDAYEAVFRGLQGDDAQLR